MDNFSWIGGLLIFLHVAVAAKDNLVTFKAMNSFNYSAAPIGSPQNLDSVLACIRMCYTEYNHCFSVTYNIKTGMCTPGDVLNYTVSSPKRGIDELLFYTSHCDTNLGFSLYVYESVIQCLHLSFVKANFTSARQICEEKSSKLYMIKSHDKLMLLRRIVKSLTHYTTWVGLSDLEQEGTFVWEDNEPAQKAFPVAWTKGQPDDSNKSEDCAEMSSSSDQLYINDKGCSYISYFICERATVN